VVESNVDNLYSNTNPQVKSKKIKFYTPVKRSCHGESKTLDSEIFWQNIL